MYHIPEEETIIKRSWEFASIIQFLFAFGKVIKLDQNLVMERLEPLLLLDAIMDPFESYNFKLISSIHACLLNQLGRKTSIALKGSRSWFSNLRKELKEQKEFYQVVHLLQTGKGDEEVSLYDCKGISILQKTDYLSLRPVQRMVLLKYLCERVAETSESVRSYIQVYIEHPNGTVGVNRKRCMAIPPKKSLEINNVRSKGLGKDAQGNQFTYFGNQEPNSKSFWIYAEDAYQGSSITAKALSTVEELSECIKGIEHSEAPRDRVLAQKLREILLRISSKKDPFPALELFRTWKESEKSSREPEPLQERNIGNESNSSDSHLDEFDSGEDQSDDETGKLLMRKCRKRIHSYILSDESDEDIIYSADSSFEISSDAKSYESDEDSSIGFPSRRTIQSHSVYFPLMTFSSNF